MKNSKIAVAALMALIMFTYTKAEEIKIDFDGLNTEATRPESGGEQFTFVKELEFPEAKAERDNDASAAAKDKPDDSLVSAIKYAEGNNSPAVSQNLKKLLTCGKKREKADFLNAAGGNYAFPERILFMQDDLQTVCELKPEKSRVSVTCVSGHKEQICNDREVCETKKECSDVCEKVCEYASAGLGGAAGIGGSSTIVGGAAIGIGTAVATDIVCHYVCKQVCEDKTTCKTVTDCKDVFICDEYQPANQGNGSAIDNWGNTTAERQEKTT